MLRGEVAGLRAQEDNDVPVLHAELHEDVATWVRADSRPWRPIPASAESPVRAAGPRDDNAVFSVVQLATPSPSSGCSGCRLRPWPSCAAQPECQIPPG
jgi:hypothetical protein